MKKICTIVFSVVLFLCAYTTVGAEEYGVDSDKAKMTGSIVKSDLIGYGSEPVYALTGTGEWSISNSPGVYRISLWITPDIAADDNASVMITSEFIKKSVSIDYGNSSFGWRELCIAECGPAGMSVILTTSPGKYANICAVRFESLGGGSRELCNFGNQSQDSAVFALYSDIAYVDGTRVRLDKSPSFAEDGVYIAQSDIGRVAGGSVKYTQDGIEFVCNEKNVAVSNGGFSVNGEFNGTAVLNTIDGVAVINIDAIFKATGRYSHIYNNQLALYSDGKIDSESKSDEKKFKNILSSVRTGM